MNLPTLAAANYHTYMPRYTKTFSFILVLILAAIPVNTDACSNIYHPERILEVSKSARESMKNHVRALRKEADAVFIGRLVDIDGESAKFAGIVNIKGTGENHYPYTWIEDEEILVGCSGMAELKNLVAPTLAEEDEDWKFYLIYAVQNRMIRARVLPQFADTPSPHEEVEWLEK